MTKAIDIIKSIEKESLNSIVQRLQGLYKQKLQELEGRKAAVENTEKEIQKIRAGIEALNLIEEKPPTQKTTNTVEIKPEGEEKPVTARKKKQAPEVPAETSLETQPKAHRFDQEAEIVARELVKGAVIVRITPDKLIKAKINSVTAYTREKNSGPRYTYLLDLNPGEVSFKNVFGTLVLNISTKNGSCVTLESIKVVTVEKNGKEKKELNGKIYEKKGEIATLLRLDEFSKDRVPGINAADKGNRQLYIEFTQ